MRSWDAAKELCSHACYTEAESQEACGEDDVEGRREAEGREKDEEALANPT